MVSLLLGEDVDVGEVGKDSVGCLDFDGCLTPYAQVGRDT